MQQRYPWLLTLVFMTFINSTFAQKRPLVNYSLYIKKVEAYQEQLKEEIRKNAPTFTELPAAYKTKQDLANNPIIREMGGLEKLLNMSTAERRALARQMAGKYQQGPERLPSAQLPLYE